MQRQNTLFHTICLMWFGLIMGCSSSNPMQLSQVMDDSIPQPDQSGPVISITNPNPNDPIINRLVTIEGTVGDSSGVDKIVINQRVVIPGQQMRLFPIHYNLSCLPNESELLIHAYDTVGNVTQKRIQLRNWNNLLTRPVIDIWNLEPHRDTLFNHILVEGQVADKNGITHVWINDTKIIINPNERVHICEEIPLPYTNNTITITAQNANHLTSSHAFNITKRANTNDSCGPLTHYNLTISLVNFNTPDHCTGCKAYREFDLLFDQLNESSCFTVLENRHLDLLRKEQDISSDRRYIRLDTLVKLANETGSNSILLIEVRPDHQDGITLNVKLNRLDTHERLANVLYHRKISEIDFHQKKLITKELIRRLIQNLLTQKDQTP